MKSYLAPSSLGFLALTILLGGSSSQGLLGNALLQLLAVVIIVWVLSSEREESASGGKAGPRTRWLGGAAVLLVLVQFIPLPPSLWSQLPGREVLARGFDLLGISLPWQTIAMSPWSALSSLAWCLPAVAIFMVTRSPRGPSFSAVAIVIAALAGISLAVGIEQITSENLYFYETTNYGTPVGFFSNVNHQATFLVCALVFWAASHSSAGDHTPRGEKPARRVIFYGVALFYVVGVILCGSIAGTGLLVTAIAGIWLLSAPKLRVRPALLATLLVLGTLGVAVYVYAGPANADFLLDTKQPGMSRWDFWSNGVEMLAHYFPFGSGLGTFEELYHLIESPAVVGRTYVNHAHNEYLELLIEAGIFGVLLLVAFFSWLARRLMLLFEGNADFAARACGMVVIVLALHSLVDYPLRTAALSSMFAAALGFLIRYPANSGGSAKRRSAAAGRATRGGA